jgi:multidrug efflux system outer membrane protein
VLSDLVQCAERGNTDLASAAARSAAAHAVLAATQAGSRPQLTASASASRQGGPLVNAAGTNGTLLTAGVQLSHEVDLAGRLAAAEGAAGLDAQARDSLLRSARLLLQADVAHTYLALRATDAERALAQRSLQAWQQTLQIGEERLRQGGVSELAVLRQRAELQAAQADALALDRRRGELEHSLALLLGEVASGFNVAERADWAPAVPAIPAGIPGDVLLRRPDVAAAAQQLQAAQTRTANARSAWWPSLALTASGGQASPGLADLLRGSMRAFGLGALLAAPLLDGGRREAGIAQAQADEELAVQASRQRVLVAFKEVEDQLLALQVLSAQAAHQAQAAAAAGRAAQLAGGRWASGLGSHLELLDAQRSALRSQAALLQAEAARAQATVGLIRALGGGWGSVLQASTAGSAVQPQAAGARAAAQATTSTSAQAAGS